MKTNKYLGITMLAATMLTAASCTDFDDYNEVPVDPTSQSGSGLSLWENISGNAELSDFRQLVERTGFQENLKQERSYTIWAPKNGFTGLSDYQAMSDSLLLIHFVKNHIAEFKFAASGKVDNQRIRMLNDKNLVFTGDGTYQFGNVAVDEANVPSRNGVMHILSDAVKFYPNLYEYIKQTDTIGLLRSHIMKYEVTKIDKDKSEKGPIVNGIQTYIDSVMVTSNSILGRNGLNAKIQSEDSTYTFIMPVDKAFTDYYNRVKTLYNYIPTMTAVDFSKFTKASDTFTKTGTPGVEEAAIPGLVDSIARKDLISNLVYNNNLRYWNGGFVDDTRPLDTIYSTNGGFFSNPKEIAVDHTIIGPVEMSNGYARVVDTLAFHPWETYNPQISSANLEKAYNNKKTSARREGVVVTVRDEKHWVLGENYQRDEFTFELVEPNGDRSKPEMFYSLPNVLSGTYRIYCVFLPAQLGNTGANKPTAMNFQLRYCNAKNQMQTYNFCANPNDAAHKAQASGAWTDNPKTLNLATAFANDTNKVVKADTIYLGDFTFPVCYKGVKDNDNKSLAPCINVTSPLSVFNATQMANYSREFRIWAFVLRPVDYDEYLKSKTTNDNE